jgi:cation/acetate symporter
MRASKIAAIGLGILFEKMNVAFLSAFVFSKLDASNRANEEIEAFDAQYVRAQTGFGAAKAAAH